jgi:Recombinase
VFAEIADGLSVRQVATGLNHDKIASPRGKIWRPSMIAWILRNRQPIGEHQHHERDENGKYVPVGAPIPDYYPKAVTAEEYYGAHGKRSRLAKVKGKGKAKSENLFSGMIRDSETGLHYHYRSATKPCLILDPSSRDSGEVSPVISYPIFEAVFLAFVTELKTDEGATNTASLQRHLAEAHAAVLRWEDAVGRTEERLVHVEDDDVRESLIRVLREQKQKVREFEARRADLAEQIASADDLPDQIRTLVQQLEGLEGEQLKLFRLRLKNKVAELVKDIWIRVVEQRRTFKRLLIQVNFHTYGKRFIRLEYSTHRQNSYVRVQGGTPQELDVRVDLKR